MNMEKVKMAIDQESFNKAFNEILEGATQRYFDSKTRNFSEKETTRIMVLDKDAEWLIDYDTNEKYPHFYYQYDRVYSILMKKFSLEFDGSIQTLMKSLVETQYKMKDTFPSTNN